MRVKQSGITLLELMVVVAIVAILAAAAYPSFTDGLRKSRRAEAFKGLLSMQLKQEEFRISNTSYSGTKSQIGDPTSDYYDFEVVLSAATATTYYILKANAKGAQIDGTPCDNLTLDKADNKTPTNCWK